MATKKKKRRKNRQQALVTMGFVALIIIISLILVLVRKFSSSSEYTDLDAYFEMTADANSETNTAILFNDSLSAHRAIVSDGGLYLSIDFVQECLNSRFYWEPASDLLIYTTPSDVIKVSTGDSNYYVGNAQNSFERVILKKGGSTVYVSADFLAMFTAFDYTVYEEPSRVVIWNDYSSEITWTTIRKDTKIRVEGNRKSDCVASVEKGAKVHILNEEDNGWIRVITDDGFFGYVQAKCLNSFEHETVTTNFVAEEYPSLQRDYRINMAWNQVTNYTANSLVSQYLSGTDGINVISPTWFYLNDNYGNIQDLASSEYVTYAHQNGLEVWALVSNFENSDVNTEAVLCDTENREHLESQIIAAAIEYKLDGINIDFEDLQTSIGDSYIQFLRELSILCHKNGIVLSVDDYAPASYNYFYYWKEQGIVCDYVILMGYDEHYSGSGAGSVASKGWVEEGIQNLVSYVPAEKCILGIPFYTRLWETTSTNEVSCTSMSMTDAWAWVNANGLETTWEESTGQYYATDIQGNSIFEVWLEDDTSINIKVLLARNYGLAGTSAWKLGQQDDSVWAVINQ